MLHIGDNFQIEHMLIRVIIPSYQLSVVLADTYTTLASKLVDHQFDLFPDRCL